jgi:CheY-like chemotaxis protein
MAKILVVDDDARNLRLAEGFDGYLEKPIRCKEFPTNVDALPEGRNE